MSGFSIASWNVRMFTLAGTLHASVVKHLKDQNPDIFALLEVVGKDVWRHMYMHFPDHNFFITEGYQTQEILVGVRKKFRSFLTQRGEFKRNNVYLRPGPFLTIQDGNDYYTILFLHLKSLDDSEGFGLRDAMIDSAFSLKNALDKVPEANGDAKFIFMGDLNTMGMEITFLPDITAADEIDRLKKKAKNRSMSVLNKDHTSTYTKDGTYFSDLDHVVASDCINFKKWGNSHVKVSGWREHPVGSAKFKEFVNKISDHCSIYCEVL